MTLLHDAKFRNSLLITVALIVVAVVPLPGKAIRSALRSVRSPELNRADRDTHAAGYYVGLIDGVSDDGRDELTLRLMGKPREWKSFQEIGATRYLADDFLQFELKPDQDKTVFGKRFTTNTEGLRDRPYGKSKADDVFRIALLGSSIDMGWGVGTEETYENRLEDWLNTHAAKRGLKRRFEVVNFAMAAYSPLHRLETYRRKVRDYRPDMVIYSATMLDARLLEIHLRNLLQERVDLRFDFLRRAIGHAQLGPGALRLDAFGEIRDKDALKKRLRPHLDAIAEATIADLSTHCRDDHAALAMILVPRAGQADAPEARSAAVTRYNDVASRLKLSIFDLSGTFDDQDPSTVEVAAWDDHPNTQGHKLLFEALAHAIAKDSSIYRTILGVDPPPPKSP